MSLFYGPVLSRRFGYSLGIDIIPFKVCVYDCLYCQLGRTTNKTTHRGHYVDINYKNFKKELKEKIKSNTELDYITFSGSGEPTLNLDIKRLNSIIKEVTEIPVAVLTSGGLLGFEGVIEDMRIVDLIKVSLDAPCQEIFEKINRPHGDISFEKNINGLMNLLENYEGRVWLEIMVLPDINDSKESFSKFAGIIKEMEEKLEKIHLNTPVRPAASSELKVPEKQKLEHFKKILGGKAEIIGDVKRSGATKDIKDIENNVYELAKRRPVTVQDISGSLGINLNQSIKAVNSLLSEKKIKYQFRQNERYYFKE